MFIWMIRRKKNKNRMRPRKGFLENKITIETFINAITWINKSMFMKIWLEWEIGTKRFYYFSKHPQTTHDVKVYG